METIINVDDVSFSYGTQTEQALKQGETPWPRGAHTGGAWLSSARVVRCWVKSRNERNPCCMLPALSWGLMRDCRR